MQKDILQTKAEEKDAEIYRKRVDAKLQKGYADMTSGKVKPAKEVFDKIRKEYGI